MTQHRQNQWAGIRSFPLIENPEVRRVVERLSAVGHQSYLKPVKSLMTVTGDHTLRADVTTILVDASEGAITVRLRPADELWELVVRVKKIDDSANAVTIKPWLDETIDGATEYVLSNQYDFVTIESDRTNFHVLGGN